MKTIAAVLSVSLAGNFVLGVVLLFGVGGAEIPRTDSGARIPAVSHCPVPVPGAPAQASPVPAAGPTAAGSGLEGAATDGARLRDRLRALGLSERIVRRVVGDLLSLSLHERMQQGLAEVRGRAGRAYWQGDAGASSLLQLPAERLAEWRERARENRAEMQRLFGPAPLDPASAYLNRRDYLPPEKSERLADLESDYNDLRLQAIQEGRGFISSADLARFRLLQEEKERDLVALLSPEEKRQYDLRQSSAAQQLRTRLQGFEASEAEYLALYALYDRIERQFPLNQEVSFTAFSAGMMAASEYATLRARHEAQVALKSEIAAVLGPERAAEYQRAQDRDYQRLQAAAQRFDLPVGTINAVYALRDQAIAASQGVLQDAQLSPEARRQALHQLAASTRQQVRSSLGATLGDAYLKQAMTWLNYLDRGQALRVLPTGFVGVDSGSRPATKG